MNGNLVVVECNACTHLTAGRALAIQGNLFGGSGDVVGGLRDEAGKVRMCPKCHAKLSAPLARVSGAEQLPLVA